MIDTITVYGGWPLRTALPGRRKLTLDSGLRVCVDAAGKTIEWVGCSLPRLLYGHNGRVLANQGELDEALAKFHAELNRIAYVTPVDRWQPWRVDLAWNFDLLARPLVSAHAGLRVPGILAGATLHPDVNGVSWRGWRSRFMVTLYDKARQMRVPGSILRPEISLRGKELRRRLTGDWRSFPELWRVYRSIMASIPPIERLAVAAGWPEAVGMESMETRQRILGRLAYKPAATFRRYRKRVEASAAGLSESFSWADVLPVDGPPPPVVCQPTRQRPVQ